MKKLISKQNGHKIFINDNYARKIQNTNEKDELFDILESLRLNLSGYSSYNYEKKK